MKKYFPVFLIFIFLILGCTSFETVESAKVLPSEISQNYKIAAAKDHTNVTAIFYAASGATVDLDAPSWVELNGSEMSESKPFFMKGTDYHYNSDKFEPTFQFAFHATDGKIYCNEISVTPLEIAAENLSLNRAQKPPIQLSRAVAKDESVTYSLRSADAQVVDSNSVNANSNVSSEIYSADGRAELDSSRTFFTIDSAQMKKFAIGKAYLTLEVSKSSDLQQTTAKGGSIISAYEAQTIPVNIVN